LVWPISTLVIIFVHFVVTNCIGLFSHLQMIDYFRLNIEDLRNSFLYKRTIIKMTERIPPRRDTNIQLSIVNSKFRLVRVRSIVPQLSQAQLRGYLVSGIRY
jgi:hypothetical protein